MFVDASAVVAILGEEAGWEELVRKLDTHEGRLYISPLARFETVQALARKQSGPSAKPSPRRIIDGASRILDDFHQSPADRRGSGFGPDRRAGCRSQCRRYGKIVGHPAALNFGDCFAYACAKALGVPLMYKGDDFSRTDLA